MKDEDVAYEATVVLAVRPDMTDADARWVGALSLSHKARGQEVARLHERVAKLEAVLAAARAWDARICWEHTDADDEERALHEAVRALDWRSET